MYSLEFSNHARLTHLSLLVLSPGSRSQYPGELRTYVHNYRQLKQSNVDSQGVYKYKGTCHTSIVDDHPNIWLIYPHAECHGCHYALKTAHIQP